jgi:hypothetical protein
MSQINPRAGARHRGASVTFSSLARATAGLPADYRCRIFGSLPETLQDAAWRTLARECEARDATLNAAAGRQA